MPDFSNCEKDIYGNAYCYDRETEEFYEISLKKVPIKKVSPEVMFKLLKKEIKVINK